MTGIKEIKETETRALQSIEKAKTDAEKIIEKAKKMRNLNDKKVWNLRKKR